MPSSIGTGPDPVDRRDMTWESRSDPQSISVCLHREGDHTRVAPYEREAVPGFLALDRPPSLHFQPEIESAIVRIRHQS